MKGYTGSISRVITVTYNTASHIKHAYTTRMSNQTKRSEEIQYKKIYPDLYDSDNNSNTNRTRPPPPYNNNQPRNQQETPQSVIEQPPYAPSTFTDPQGYTLPPVYRMVPRHASRKVGGIKPSRFLLVGGILWIVSIVGYSIPNLTIMALASGLNFISFVILLIPCCAGHCWCPHDDHGCCYEEYK